MTDEEGRLAAIAPGTLRVAAVSYLNAKPLVHALVAPGWRVRRAPPARVADALAAGELDLALVSSVELLRQPGLVAISDAVIASSGPVDSVFLRHRVPLDQVRTLALDPDSRTSQVLALIVLEERFGVRPRVLECNPSKAWEEGLADAVLIIGDAGFAIAGQPEVYDLATAWRKRFGLPFVFARWLTTEAVLRRLPDLPLALETARDAGVAAIEDIAALASIRRGLEASRVRTYLRERLHYRLGRDESAGLDLFLQRAKAYDPRSVR